MRVSRPAWAANCVVLDRGADRSNIKAGCVRPRQEGTRRNSCERLRSEWVNLTREAFRKRASLIDFVGESRHP
jgi:hypothetical protein